MRRQKKTVSGSKKIMAALNNATEASLAHHDIDWSCTGQYDLGNGEKVGCRRFIIESTMSPLSKPKITEGIEGTRYAIYAKYYKDVRLGAVLMNKGVWEYINPLYQFGDGTMLFTNFWDYGAPCSQSKLAMVEREERMKYNSCYGIIDVNGFNGPNKFVKCTRGTNKTIADNLKTRTRTVVKSYGTFTEYSGEPVVGAFSYDNSCYVDSKDVNDMFPVMFLDGTVIPYDSAAAYVLRTAR